MQPTLDELGVEFVIDPHNDASHMDSIARAINVDLVLVDYNIPAGQQGDAIVKAIRQFAHNDSTPIIFHSSNIEEKELEKLVEGLPNVISVHRDDLEDAIMRFLRRG